MKALCIVMVLALASPAFGQTRACLEVPADFSLQSGLGFISGWGCSGRNVEIVLNGLQRLSVARNIPRADTQSECGDTNNGFITQMNWNLLGTSNHTAALVVDGRTIQEHAFSVSTPGEEFIRGLERAVEVNDFPSPGESTTLVWQEATQGFVLRFTPPSVPPVIYPAGILPRSGLPGRGFLPPNNYLHLIAYDTTLDEAGDWNISATGITWDTLTAVRGYILSSATAPQRHRRSSAAAASLHQHH